MKGGSSQLYCGNLTVTSPLAPLLLKERGAVRRGEDMPPIRRIGGGQVLAHAYGITMY
jgi:hypothetical protein